MSGWGLQSRNSPVSHRHSPNGAFGSPRAPYCQVMTLAATRRHALALSGVIGVVTSIIAAALIAVVLGNPERAVLAMSDSDLSAIVYLMLDRLASVAVAVWRLFA